MSQSPLTFAFASPCPLKEEHVELVALSPQSFTKEEQDVLDLYENLQDHLDECWVSSQKEAL